MVPGEAQDFVSMKEVMADFAAMTIIFDLTQDRPEDLKKLLEKFASINWSIGTKEGILDTYSFDDHPAESIRCNALPACFDAFYEIYGIQEGDRIYIPKEKRLSLW